MLHCKTIQKKIDISLCQQYEGDKHTEAIKIPSLSVPRHQSAYHKLPVVRNTSGEFQFIFNLECVRSKQS